MAKPADRRFRSGRAWALAAVALLLAAPGCNATRGFKERARVATGKLFRSNYDDPPAESKLGEAEQLSTAGQYDKADRKLPLSSGGAFDASGGWYDAAADWGKHFTQLSNLSYFNTLSIPLTAWALAASHDQIAKRGNTDLVAAQGWLLDEALFGADYLTRVHVKGGSFYSSVGQPEADDLGADPTQRSLSTRQVDFREGGGLALTAMCRSRNPPAF